MWVRFVDVHFHRFNAQFKQRFMPGQERNLPKAVADKAVAAGHAIRMKKASRNAKPEPVDGDDA